MTTLDLPLTSWRFAGELRKYQRDILERMGDTINDVDADNAANNVTDAADSEDSANAADRPTDAAATSSVPPARRLHIVAPPGAGKTLVGLLLAMRDGRRAIALSPAVTIRQQWRETAAKLAPEGNPQAVSDDPAHPGDLTVLTYQSLSVLADSSPYDNLARTVWIDELVEGGREQNDAETWLVALANNNPKAYRTGIRRRSSRLRKAGIAEDPSALAQALHPNAVALVDRLVEQGIRTVILDECHHLLDHWALVVRYLCARIRAHGSVPLLIGLTATLPSAEDVHFENYSQLLGEVDYEVPTPAVIREGNLAPSRDIVWFTTPTAPELEFVSRHDKALNDLLRHILSTPEGLDFLVSTLQPPVPSAQGDTNPNRRRSKAANGRIETDIALARAFDLNFDLARAAAAVLTTVHPKHPLVAALPAESRHGATADETITVIARYTLTRVLPNPDRNEEWRRTKAVLADFGYRLTDRGLRRGHDPVEQVLATSAAKDAAAIEVLHHELSSDDGERVRAVIVTDFATHGNARGSNHNINGALRCFATLVRDPQIAALCPVLITAQHLRVATAHASTLCSRLAKQVGVEVIAEPLASDPLVANLKTETTAATVLAALGSLITKGYVRVLVGTRGLLGEGWDCPSINTLIDLTATATSAATQQLRGRTMRLDPQWPTKVAHNWTVTCLLPAILRQSDASEVRRLERKHEVLWGVDLVTKREILTGFAHAMSPTQIAAEQNSRDVTAMNQLGLNALEPRSETYRRWGIGEPYANEESEAVQLSGHVARPQLVSELTLAGALSVYALALVFAFYQALDTYENDMSNARGDFTGDSSLFWIALPCVLTFVIWAWFPTIDLIRRVRLRARPERVYVGAVHAIADTFADKGQIPRIASANIRVRPRDEVSERVAATWEVAMPAGTVKQQRLVINAVTELFGPVDRPRFLLRIDRGPVTLASLLSNGVIAVLDRLLPQSTLLPVPKELSRRREDAERFADYWRQWVGPCELHELRGTDGAALFSEARRRGSTPESLPSRRRVWS